jgi:ribonuclease HI
MCKYYAVKVGKVPGIYLEWEECKRQVDGYPGAIHKSFKSKIEAERFITEEKEPEQKSYEGCVVYVDGGQNKQSGKVAWGRVVYMGPEGKIDLVGMYPNLTTDMELVTVDLPKAPQTTLIVASFKDVVMENNGAELLAMLFALRLASIVPEITEICSDSQLVVDYWSLGKYKAGIIEKKLKVIQECTILRKQFMSRGGKVTKIYGDDNYADLGYH